MVRRRLTISQTELVDCVRWLVSQWASLVLILALTARPLAADDSTSAVSVLQQLRSFQQLGTLLHVAAHPDDENTQLITYFARGRGFRTAYLSITRGDGGQNLLGAEFDEQLGVIRTQELLAARRLDGGRQFFTRAVDFGFSKSDQETLRIWDHEQILGDVVRVIRSFRPDVIITQFSPQPSGTHGHHTASAVLALEAFKLAGDPQAYPDQLKTLAAWQPKRILQGGRGGGARRGGQGATAAAGVRIEIGGSDPVLNATFNEIAGRSRAMHKSQGFGETTGGRGRGGGPPPAANFSLLDGEPATQDPFDGIDTTWGRFAGGTEIGLLTEAAIANFNSDDLAANVPALLKIRHSLSALPSDPLVTQKGRQLDAILQACLGLTVQTTIAEAEKVPGEALTMNHTASIRSSNRVRWVAVRYPTTKAVSEIALDLQPGVKAEKQLTQTLPTDMPLSQPYWLRDQGTVGMYRVDDAALIGTPENAPAFPCEFVFEIDGQTLIVADEPVQLIDSSGPDSIRRRLDVIPPATLKFASEVRLFSPGAARAVEVDVEAFRPAVAGDVQLKVPEGWSVAPSKRPFSLVRVGDKQRVAFEVTAPGRAETTNLAAQIEVRGARFENSRIEIKYDHIPRQLLQPRARLMAVSLDLATRGKRVGYLAGAGDSIAESLEQMGYEVTQLSGEDLTTERLKDFDAVVIGIRALNTRQDLTDRMPNLFAYVEGGGNVVVQYNRPNGLRVTEIAPYALQLSGDRVTDETAKMHLLAPDHPAFNSPNKISDADFSGWVQERGLYFPNQWDERFKPLLACNDPGEAPLEGGLLVAQHGKGYFVYTSLAWFRQLPAGVPGAYRLFANLVSLGK
jgi:LmbE family N-acetylglucosaminyl deacetylase